MAGTAIREETRASGTCLYRTGEALSLPAHLTTPGASAMSAQQVIVVKRRRGVLPRLDELLALPRDETLLLSESRSAGNCRHD